MKLRTNIKKLTLLKPIDKPQMYLIYNQIFLRH
jgi:hypothetical protein